MVKQSSSNAGRAAELLILLGHAGAKGLSLGAMADACGEARSSVHRTLTALSDYGFVVQGGNRGSYRLGPAAYALSLRTPSINEIISTYQPALIEATANTNLSSYLMMRSGLDTICIASQMGEIFAQPYVSGIGGRIPLGVGVSGIVILGIMEEKSFKRASELLTPKWAEWGITAQTIAAEVALYREQGHFCGIRRAHGIETLTMTIPLINDTWTGLEAAISLIAPLNVLGAEAQTHALSVMKEAMKAAEMNATDARKI